jgi:uncharacterized protein (TIGR02722 family)
MKKRYALIVLALMSVVTACHVTSVKRVEMETAVDLSERWNDTDSRLTAEEMIKDAVGRHWVDDFLKKQGRDPYIIVGTVVNKSHDHIPTETFTKDLERELTNSGRVRFVASKGERQELREERADQEANSSRETVKESGKEIGADYMLKGVINSFEDELQNEIRKQRYKYFEVTLEMIDLETNTKVWYGDKKIKKLLTRSRLGM